MLSKIPLKLILIAIIIVQVAAGVGLTAELSIHNAKKAVHDMAIQLLDEIRTLTGDHISTYLETPHQLNSIHVNDVEIEQINAKRDIRTLSSHLVKSLQTFKEVSFTVFATPQGQYIGARRDADGNLQIGVIDEATQGNLQYYATNERGDFVEPLQDIDLEPGYVLKRPWYVAAVEAKTAIWSQVYTTRSTESLVITAAQPVYSDRGELLGVFSTTIPLKQIDQFLNSIKIGKSGQAFILDDAGRVIATSTGEDLYRVVKRDGVKIKEILQATESQNPFTRAVAKALLDPVGNLASVDTGQSFELIINNQKEFVKVTLLPEYINLDWRIVVVAKEEDFRAHIDANRRNTIWLYVGAVALATGSSILTSNWITRPLWQLNQTARKIAQGNLHPSELPQSDTCYHIREVSELNDSFAQMTKKIHEYFSEIQTSEANFKNIAANVPGAIFRYILRPDGTDAVFYMSPGCLHLWEIEAHLVEQDASMLWEMVDPEDLPAMQASVRESARTLETWHHEWRITTLSGCRKWLQAIGQPTHQTDGVVEWDTVIIDVSDRKQAELALKVQKDFNELIAKITSRFVDLSPDNLDREIEQALQDICKVTGIDTSYIFQVDESAQTFSMTHEWSQSIYPRQIEQVQNIPFADFPWSIEMIKGRELIYIPQLDDLPEVAGVDCSNWRRFNLVSLLIIPLVQKSKVKGFMGFASYSQPMNWEDEIIRLLQIMGQTIANAQERNQIHTNLMKSEARWQFALEGSGDGVWDWNAQTKEVFFSRQWKAMLGYEEHEIGNSLEEWNSRIHPEDQAQCYKDLEQHLTGKTPLYQNEHRLRGKDNTYRWILDRGKVIEWTSEGKPVRIIGTHTDITNRKQVERQLQNLTNRLELAARSAHIGIWEWDIARDRLIWDNRMYELYGISKEDFSEAYEAWQVGVHPEDQQISHQAIEQALKGEKDFDTEFRVLWPDGTVRYIEAHGMVLRDEEGCPSRMIGVNWDITDRKHTELALEQGILLSKTLFDTSIDGIVLLNQQGYVIQTSVSFAQMLGYTIEETYTLNVFDWDAQLKREDLQAILDGRILLPPYFETRHRRKDGSIYDVEISYSQEVLNGQIVHFCICRDISDRKQAEEQLIYSALHDALTDLPNRTLLTNRLESSIQKAQLSNTYHFAVIFLDLDQFKVINESLGHLLGDKLLLTVAQKLRSIISSTDLAARFGGDEFVILLEDIPNIETVIYRVEDLLAEFDQPIVINGHSVFVTTSIGIVWGTNAYTEASNILRDADIALYQAKAKGRRRYEVFDVEMHVQAVQRLKLEHDLHIAINQQQFVTYYQPIVDLHTQRLSGFEALIRWQHPTQGFISPAQFIPVAEETGLIVPISHWMLLSACQQVATWQRQFPDMEDLKISINLSGQDLRQPNLLETIQHILQQTQLPATSLTLEITESILIENIEISIDLLQQLKGLGIRISIDDFGTGYSSLSYLYNLPANYLKIDQSFVSKMQLGNKNYKIVQAVVSLSDQLELAAVAEGIETSQQLAWLKELGCEFGQGYFLSRPLTSEAAVKLLSKAPILMELQQG